MNKIVSVSVCRFNTPQHQNINHYEIGDEASISKIKDVLLADLADRKDEIIASSKLVYEDDETDGFENDRQETYDALVEKIQNVQEIKDFEGHWMLDDGMDEDTEETINSAIYINIASIAKV